MSAWILSAHATGRDVFQHFCRLRYKLRKVSPYQRPSPGLEDDARESALPFLTPLTTSTPPRCKTTLPVRDSVSFSTALVRQCAASSSSTSRHGCFCLVTAPQQFHVTSSAAIETKREHQVRT